MTLIKWISRDRADRVHLGILAFAAFVYMVVFSALHAIFYKNMVYYDQDLGHYAQIFWNLSRGSSTSSVLGLHFLNNHLNYIFYPLAGLYFFFQHPFFLLFSQSLSLGLGGIFAYQIARIYLSPRQSLGLGLLYFFYPPVGFTNLNEFHPVCYAVPFLFLTVICYLKREFKAFMIFALLAMSCQENIPIAIFMFSVVALIDRRGRRWIFVPAGSAILWLGLSLIFIQPRLSPHSDWVEIYAYLGNSLPEVVTNFFIQPARWLPKVFSWSTGGYLFQLLGPLLFLPLACLKCLLFLIPYLLQHILSVRTFEASIYYHYTAEMLPFLFWGTASGLAWFFARFGNTFIRRLMIAVFIAAILAANIFTSPYREALRRFSIVQENRDLNYFKRQFLTYLPADASVAATTQFFPYLANRRQLYSFYYIYRRQRTSPNSKYTPPKHIDYALIDINDVFITQSFDNNVGANFFDFLDRYAWNIVDNMEDVIFLKRGRPNIEKLFVRNPVPARRPDLIVGKRYQNEIFLEGFDINYSTRDDARIVQLTIYWQAVSKPKHKYKLIIGLADGSGRTLKTYDHHICYGFFPTNYWDAGDTIVENYQLVLPRELWDKPLIIRATVRNEDNFEKEA